jgi:hypothetical protein
VPTDYDITTISQETAVVSPTATLEVSRVGFTTNPSGVIAYVNVPAKNQTAAQVATTVEQYALLIETAMRHQGVTGAYFAQDVDASGLLTDYLVFIVGYESTNPARLGPYQAEVWVRMVNLGAPTAFAEAVGKPIDAAYHRLATIVEG